MSVSEGAYSKKLVRPSFEDTVSLVKTALIAEGFDVLSEIDLGAMLKQDLAFESRRYSVLCACNVSYTYKALAGDSHQGPTLLCYAVIQESQEDQRGMVSIADPTFWFHSGDDPAIASLAREADECIRRIIRSLH